MGGLGREGQKGIEGALKTKMSAMKWIFINSSDLYKQTRGIIAGHL